MKWERDKKLHLLAGLIISLVVGAGFILRTDFDIIGCAIAGTLVAVAIGYAKECFYDAAHPDTHTVDVNDFYATTLGGVVGAIILIAADRLIQVLS